jgi:hypothetical protein
LRSSPRWLLSGNRFGSRYIFSSTALRLLDGLAADQAHGDVLGDLALHHTGEDVVGHPLFQSPHKVIRVFFFALLAFLVLVLPALVLFTLPVLLVLVGLTVPHRLLVKAVLVLPVGAGQAEKIGSRCFLDSLQMLVEMLLELPRGDAGDGLPALGRLVAALVRWNSHLRIGGGRNLSPDGRLCRENTDRRFCRLWTAAHCSGSVARRRLTGAGCSGQVRAVTRRHP